MILRFESVEEYAAEVRASKLARAKVHPLTDNSGQGREWDLGVSPKEALSRATVGDPGLVTRATEAVDKLAASDISDVLRMTSVRNYHGTRVDVQAYLGGSPRAMVRRVKRDRATLHVSLYVSLTCSCGVDADSMLTRGTTILALLEALQARQVGVDLYLVCDTDGGTDGDLYQVIRVESRPLDLSVSSFAIAHPAFTRNICYGYAEHADRSDGTKWSRSFYRCGSSGQSKAYADHMRKTLGLSEADLFIPPVYLTDPLIQTPDVWLAETLAKIAGGAS